MANMTNTGNESLNKANGSASHEFKNKMHEPLQSQSQSTENQLEKFSKSAGEKIGAMASNISDSASSYVNSGKEYIVENPYRGVAIAAAAGLVFGSIMTLVLRARK